MSDLTERTLAEGYDIQTKQRDRIRALEADNEALRTAADLLREIGPAVRDIMWCALVWNDHNFGHDSLLAKARAARDALEMRHGDVDAFNSWMADVDAALAIASPRSDGDSGSSPGKSGADHG